MKYYNPSPRKSKPNCFGIVCHFMEWFEEKQCVRPPRCPPLGFHRTAGVTGWVIPNPIPRAFQMARARAELKQGRRGEGVLVKESGGSGERRSASRLGQVLPSSRSRRPGKLGLQRECRIPAASPTAWCTDSSPSPRPRRCL